MPAPLVLLHGFTQTGAAWDGVRDALDLGERPVVAPDQRGHGTAGSVRPILLPAMAADAMAAGAAAAESTRTGSGGSGPSAVAAAPLALAGYSMGGRAALLAAQASPGRVTHLALISTTAGLEDDAERTARRAADALLADELEADGLEAFARRWADGPLFADAPAPVRESAQRDRLRNDAAGLAASLRGAGTGSMGSLWAGLPALTMPTLVMAGERDEKFVAIAQRLAGDLPDSELVIVPGAGHQLPLEAPSAVAAALTRLLER